MVWDPFEEIERMHEDIDRVFSDMWGRGRPRLGYRGRGRDLVERGGFRSPICNLHETENNIILSFEIPGVDKSNIDLTVQDDNVTVKVESKVEKEKKGEEDSYSYEMQSKSFFRRVPLPKEVESDKAKAEYKKGVLRIELPKKHKTEKKGKKIDIE